ncbi:uncharacterized protein LOC101850223 [Aplysia californica]|uniref:Uncharacterized protein LOC101850223 n=1 Tax=Aplysia californica TaxID=6500 RepID=A0ABM0JCE9_APLCA|nr:uncharacterized protein LOC101850223 [Aplysia californica]
MTGTEKFLVLALLLSTTSSMLYSRQRHRWSSPLYRSSYTPSSSSSPSPSLLRIRQRLNAIKHRPPLGSKYQNRLRNICRVEAVLLRLQPPLSYAETCDATLVHTFGCRGGCSSYSSVDPRNATNILHSCSCCQPLRFMMSIAELPCKNGQHIRVPVKKALRCTCRPCYSDNSAKDTVKLRDLLTRAAVNTPFPLG